jgi:hypothetical protein
MSHQALTIFSREAASVAACSDKWSPRVREPVNLLFLRAARNAKVQFAPHRLVGNYADYRRLDASKYGPFG